MSADPNGPTPSSSASPSAPSAGDSELTIKVDDGQGAVTTWTLRCNPPRGTHPSPEAACRALQHGAAALRPVPPDRACTEIYGGPETAEITGTWDGKQIHSKLSRINGCEIQRWNTLKAVLAP